MNHAVLGAVCAISVSGIFGSGCGPGAVPSANSFTKVYEVIGPNCANNFCHYDSVPTRYSALDMSTRVRAFWSLVGQPSLGPACFQQGTRVVPGDPDASILYLKVSMTTPKCGSQMPADRAKLLTLGSAMFSGTALALDQQQLIRSWIEEGAQNN